jgi:hypothetical protein
MKLVVSIALWLTAALPALALAGTAPTSVAQGRSKLASPRQSEPPGKKAEFIFASPTRPDRSGRVVAAVMLDGKGPFRFLLDSAADASMISPRILPLLGLRLTQGSVLRVQGATGVQMLPWVDIGRLQVGDVVRTHVKMPLVDGAVLEGLDGVLGMAGLGARDMEVDFAHNWVSIFKGARLAAPGFLVVPASRTAGGMLEVTARIGTLSVPAIIDTGASNTLGNAALRMALIQMSMRNAQRARVFGVTRQVASGGSIRSPTIAVGPIAIRHLHIVYTHVSVFKVWNLDSRPAAIIGMDVLGSVSALILDYSHPRLLILPRPPQSPEVAADR